MPDAGHLSEEELGRAAARGGVWGAAAEISSRAAQVIVFFTLATFLSPAEFGAAAVAFFCVQIANSLTYAGLGQAVQVLGRDPRRDRTAVGLGLVLSLTGAGALLVLAGPICDALDTPSATGLVRLVGLALPLGQLSEVMSAFFARELRFRTTSSAIIIASVVSVSGGLALAAAGAGAYALVAQNLLLPGTRLIVLFLQRPAALRPALHRAEARSIWQLGRELLTMSIFETTSGNIDNVVVSAVSGAAALGAYGFGYNLAAISFYVVGLAVSRTALPVYAQIRARAASLAPAFLRAVEAVSWGTALPLGFLAVAGPAALEVLFGDKWHAIDQALRLLALNAWLRAVETASTSVLLAVEEAATTRRVQQLQLVLAAALLVPLVMWRGPFGAAVAVLLATTVGTTCSLAASTRQTATSRGVLLRRLAEAAFAGSAGGVVGWLVLHAVGGVPGLALGIVAALATWVAAFVVLRPDTVRLVRATTRRA